MVSPRESTEGDWWRDVVVVSPSESRGGLVEGRSGGQPQRVHGGGLAEGRSAGLLTGGGDTHSA